MDHDDEFLSEGEDGDEVDGEVEEYADNTALAIEDEFKLFTGTEKKRVKKKIKSGLEPGFLTNDVRIRGKNALNTLENNSRLVEQVELKVAQIAKIHMLLNVSVQEYELRTAKYFTILLDINFQVKQGKTLSEALAMIIVRYTKDGIMWNAPEFDALRDSQIAKQRTIREPYKPKKGVQCGHCKKYNTVSYDRQDRGRDEGPSLYIYCLEESCEHITRLRG